MFALLCSILELSNDTDMGHDTLTDITFTIHKILIYAAFLISCHTPTSSYLPAWPLTKGQVTMVTPTLKLFSRSWIWSQKTPKHSLTTLDIGCNWYDEREA